MDWKSIPITTLIPQRPPFVMVDRVTTFNDVDAITELTVREDNIFVDGGQLSAAGIIENMAQSCAARMGCLNMMRSEAVRIGFIGDIRDCNIMRQPQQGEVATTTVHIVEEVFHLTLADVCSMVGDETIASARVKIALMGIASTENE